MACSSPVIFTSLPLPARKTSIAIIRLALITKRPTVMNFIQAFFPSSSSIIRPIALDPRVSGLQLPDCCVLPLADWSRPEDHSKDLGLRRSSAHLPPVSLFPHGSNRPRLNHVDLRAPGRARQHAIGFDLLEKTNQ